MTHSTILTWPWLGSSRFLLYRLVQSLSPLTNLSILLYSGDPFIVVNILTLVLAWKQDISLPFPLRPRGRGREFLLSCVLGGTWDHLFLSCIGWYRLMEVVVF